MRSVWKGNITYRASAIPVKAYGATEERGIDLHQLHVTDGGRIRMKRTCELDGEEIPPAEIGRGYEMPGGDVVTLTEEDFALLPAATRSIKVCAFAPLEQLDPVYFTKSYYLEPEVTGTKSYVLLSEGLQQSRKVAVVRFALRQRESLGVLRVHDQVLILETMLWPDEVRSADFPFLHEDVDLRPAELREVVSSIEQLSTNFVPTDYTDHYREALDELITAKAEGREVVRPAAAEEEAGAADLVTALRDGVAESEGTAESVRKARDAERKAGEAKETAKKAAARPRTRSKPRQ
ncbi:MAG: Ku protein [Pseudonocardiaceae bacterium]|nr:Ku protein [Pseudonocardiaceae bacterium]